jgi:hypothetical protein
MTVVLRVLVQVQIKPLIDQLGRVKDLPVPEFGSLQAWEAQAGAAGRAANGDNAGDSKSHLGYNGAPMPCSGDTKVTLCCFKGIIISGLHSIRNKKLREVSDH